MSSAGIVGFLSGLLGGATTGYARAKDQEGRQKREAREDETFNRQKKQWDEQDAEKAAVSAAAGPVAVNEIRPVTMDDDGNTMPGTPAPTRYSVGSKEYADRAAAEAAAAEANAAPAVTQRISQAQRAAGNVTGAAQTEAAALQAEASRFTLSKAQADKVREDTNRTLMSAGSADALAEKLSGSALVGGRPVTVVKTADGKAQFSYQAADGSQKLYGDAFTDDAKGRLAAIKPLLQLDTSQHLQFLHADAQAETQRQQFQATQDQQKAFHADQVALQRQSIAASAGNAAATRAQAAATLEENKRQFDLKNPETKMTDVQRIQSAAITKSIGILMTQLAKDDGTNPDATKRLEKMLAKEQFKFNSLVEGVGGAAGGKDDDKLGLFGSAPAPAPAAAPPASTGSKSAAGPAKPPAPATPPGPSNFAARTSRFYQDRLERDRAAADRSQPTDMTPEEREEFYAQQSRNIAASMAQAQMRR